MEWTTHDMNGIECPLLILMSILMSKHIYVTPALSHRLDLHVLLCIWAHIESTL